jgi:hypothetical protein
MKRLRIIGLGVMLVGCLASCNTASTADAVKDSYKAFPAKVTVPTGTPIRVVLGDSVGTEMSKPGMEFSVRLAAPVVVNGKTVLEKGTAATGRVLDVQRPGRVKGRARLSLTLTSVEKDGKLVPVETQAFAVVAGSDKKRDAGIIGGAAGVGAAIGAITGGKKGAATGAAIGGAGGTATVLATRGDDLHYPPETRLNFVLAKPLTI